MSNEEGCDERIMMARKQAFSAGRRAGIWLAFNGPQAKAKARGLDVRAMRRQDVALEGLGDVFGRAEQNARIIDKIRRMRSRQQQAPPAPVLAQEVLAPPAPASAPAPAPAPAQRIRLTPENASNYIGRTVFFTSGGQPHSATITRVSPSGITVQGGPPSIRNNLVFKGRALMV